MSSDKNLKELERSLFSLRLKQQAGELKDYSQIRKTKVEIARMLTKQNQTEKEN